VTTTLSRTSTTKGPWRPRLEGRVAFTIRAQRQTRRDQEEEHHDEGEFGDANVVLDDLSWRVEKLRLEERNTQRFLRAGPRFLPYDECRKWVQAWGSRWDSEDDWRQWIAMGEKRNPYIPSRPDEYYGSQWVSWEHFLGVPPPDKKDVVEEDRNVDDGRDV
jgi:hypothetical protein